MAIRAPDGANNTNLDKVVSYKMDNFNFLLYSDGWCQCWRTMLCTRHISGGRISTKFAQGCSTVPRFPNDSRDLLFAMKYNN